MHPLKFLFIHQNFPGQFVHMASALASRGHQVVAIGVHALRQAMRGLRYVRHRLAAPVRTADPAESFMQEWAAKRARAESAALAMTALKAEGFVPDVIFGHPGWGEMLHARDVFPHGRHLVFAEFYYGAQVGDSFFDPEFQRGAPDMAALHRLKLKNTHLLHALADCDEAVSPKSFQKSKHPAAFLDRIRVIHDGIDTDRFQPNSRASVKLHQAQVELKPGDEVATFVARQPEPYRGYHVFMRSLARLEKLRPCARVVILGGSDTASGARPPSGQTFKNIFLNVVKSDLDMSRVYFVGQVPHEVLQQLLQVSAVHTYLTYPFGLSWSMLEAMSHEPGGAARGLAYRACVGRRGARTQRSVGGLLLSPGLGRHFGRVSGTKGRPATRRQAARQTVLDRYDLKRLCLPAMIDMAEQMLG